jgi:maltokinase
VTSLPTPSDAALDRALEVWLPDRRWFAAKGRPFARPHIVHRMAYPHSGEQPPWRAELLVVEVSPTHVDPPHHYLVPVAIRATVTPEQAPHVIARFEDCVVYDALTDPDIVRHIVQGLLAGDAGHPLLAVHREGPAPVRAAGAGTVRLLPGEQSNTSVVVDDVIVKFFRRLRAGENPESELLRLLTRAGEPHVPGLLASLTGPLGDRPTGTAATATYAVAQRFLPAARNGWEVALADVGAVAHGADGATLDGFTRQTRQMGRTVAQVHRALADVAAPTVLTRGDLRTITTRMHDRLAAAVRAVAELRDLAGAIAGAYQDLANCGPGVAVQRVHGDLHLGQLLKTGTRWSVIDFEGEPNRTLEERRAPHPVAKDIAGLLRSFDYAEHHFLLHERVPADSDVRQRAHDWTRRNQDAFCVGYAGAAGTDPRDHPVLLRAYLMDKAVYEVLYEIHNRPRWVSIPMRALRRLVQDDSTEPRP